MGGCCSLLVGLVVLYKVPPELIVKGAGAYGNLGNGRITHAPETRDFTKLRVHYALSTKSVAIPTTELIKQHDSIRFKYCVIYGDLSTLLACGLIGSTAGICWS
ncbi:hypothetical protein C7212DRAFT_361139 [Tuber magnatum]|uniref:Uncharacterized protein n=1 Tax=Tuber magnatum TaxID=42249 RepID=A0A317T0D3_9PEZI|nr:hypothetical protein C7212DRAFT_361139 [Tuber magnatum]